VLCRRVADAYAGVEVRRPAPRFAEYAARERALAGGAELERAAAFWRGRLELPASELTFRGRRPLAGALRTRRFSAPLGAERSRRLRELADRLDPAGLSPTWPG